MNLVKHIPAILMAFTFSANAQNVEETLAAIEANNSYLNAIRSSGEADKAGFRTDITLPDPDIDFAHHWLTDENAENVKELSLKQSFDLSTILGYRGNVADKQGALVDLQYKQVRMNTLLEAKVIALKLIHNSKLKAEIDENLKNANLLVGMYQKRLDSGDGNIIELNKTKMALAKVSAEAKRLDIEHAALAEELKRLNGGNDINLSVSEYPSETLPDNFEEWFANVSTSVPALQYATELTNLRKEQVRLSKMQNAPKIFAGYKTEWSNAFDKHSLLVGMNLPLWSNRKKTKHTQCELIASEHLLADANTQTRSNLEILYNRTKGLKLISEEFLKNVNELNSVQILDKALNAGQISLLEYISDIEMYYDIRKQSLNAELDYRLSLAELLAAEL